MSWKSARVAATVSSAASDLSAAAAACSDYRIDVTAERFGDCVCGYPKRAHAVPSAGEPRAAPTRRSFGGATLAATAPRGPKKKPDGPLLPGWSEAKAPDGSTYYTHAETKATTLKRPDLDRLRLAFRHYDADKSGALGRGDGMHPHPFECDALFTEADLDPSETRLIRGVCQI
ncbi:hypothetical protein EMIHUDRAFT_206942 [Emiliania huxleyi CCMP1516]|uniref:WW domain-containing protein n=2 Tax=Emiliania huxleyi TaxID=2903 RepID=A0A0D3JKA8_EMIH1|nr:hypothetical protein EMIHUDRAFT_206942 [Emiliania huxleyi CCMP1516]EOD23943.1 hypothetical protein EMIHUDRAFT_206942 [Emiliania huxleyi CCMP1516]|eukprot:XP_005776372.1 hypothetical protein EMIHUDRAFT_206942 [Emiliania huxleyi CCMP1516]